METAPLTTALPLRQSKDILSVSQLNRLVRQLLEETLGPLTVLGEISNFSQPSSGHRYFSLKDENAQIKCAFFRNRGLAKGLELRNGMQIQVRGHLSLYEPRGDYQLIVESVEEAGIGDLHRQFELLKQKLSALGLFELSRKRPLPAMPKTIAVISSRTGAALQDILSTLNRRYPLAKVLVYVSEVQGKQAPEQLIRALALANQQARAEVLILARGGGSLEDLWAFNDEQLAHAIHQSAIPIVSGVGHETDFSIADFVADLRAATPTAAAEAVSPDQMELLNRLGLLEKRLCQRICFYWEKASLVLAQQRRALSAPKQRVKQYWQKLDLVELKLHSALQKLLQLRQQRLNLAQTRLKAQQQNQRLQNSRLKLNAIEQQLQSLMQQRLESRKRQLQALMATLNAVSPLSTLDRGYAIVNQAGRVILHAASLKQGDTIGIRFAEGSVFARVLAAADD